MGNNNSVDNDSIKKLKPYKINFFPLNPNFARIVHEKKIKYIKQDLQKPEQDLQKPEQDSQKKYLKYKKKYIMLKNNL